MANTSEPVIYSALSRNVTVEGITVHVRIYRPSAGDQWVLEVIDKSGAATFWGKLFESEAEAWAAFQVVASQDGLASLLDGGGQQTIH